MRHPPLQDSTASLYTFVSENRQMPPAVCCARSSSPLGPPPRVRPFSQLAGPRRPRPPCPKTARPAAWWTSPLAVLPGPKLSTCRLEHTPAPPGHSSERGYAAAEIARVGKRTPTLFPSSLLFSSPGCNDNNLPSRGLLISKYCHMYVSLRL